MPKFWQDRNFSFPFICWVLFILWYIFFSLGAFDGLRLKSQDLFTSLNHAFQRPSRHPDNIIIVAIDNYSLSKVGLKWPWKRRFFAQLTKKIAKNSPRVIGFDFVFSGASEDKDDLEFEKALKIFPNTVLAYYWQGEDKKTLPLQNFRENAKAIGFVNKPKDFDGVIRNIRTFVTSKKGIDFSFDLKLASAYLGFPLENIEVKGNQILLGKNFFVPTSRFGITPLNYLFLAKDLKVISAYKVLKKDLPSSLFKDKIVLVGSTASILHDEHPTPLGNLSGVIISANSLSMILNRNYLLQVPTFQTYLLIFILGILILGINRSRSFLKSSIFTLFILIFTFIFLLYLRFKGIQFGYFDLFFLSIGAYAISNLYKYSYLLFISNKLKNLAIVEPLTGSYTLRYFSLRLDEELKSRGKNISVLAITPQGFKSLTKEYSFEETNSFLKNISQFLELSLKKEFKRIMFTRTSEDIFLVSIFGKEKEKIKKIIENFLNNAKNTKFKLKDTIVNIYLKVSLAFKTYSKNISAKNFIYLAVSSLKKLLAESKEDLVCVDVGETLWEDIEKIPSRDDFDFLVSDLEARNEELSKVLKELKQAQRETEKAYFELIFSLVKALEEKDTFTQGHSERVANYALGIAKEVGLSSEECQLIYRAGLLHDIGKIGLPDYILHKKEKLSEEEVNFIKKHEIMSVDILKPIKAFKELLPIIFHHHERFDGTGYPYGLAGNMIPKGAQILAVADAFDAITSGRGYKVGKSFKEAIEELERWSGTQFNPQYVEAFKRYLGSL